MIDNYNTLDFLTYSQNLQEFIEIICQQDQESSEPQLVHYVWIGIEERLTNFDKVLTTC